MSTYILVVDDETMPFVVTHKPGNGSKLTSAATPITSGFGAVG